MNIASLFIEYSQENPQKEAFIIPLTKGERIVTYQDFYSLVSRYRNGLINSGHKKGDRVILLMPIDIEFYALMMAIFSLGMVAVFLDPGIGIKKMLIAIKDSRAKTILSIHKFFKFRFLIPVLWGKKLYSKDSKGLFLNSLSKLKSEEESQFEAEVLKEEDHFLITFTSGSTGRSKGSDRNAINVYNQVDAIKKLWPCDSDQVDFSSFLMFGFMNLAYGITTILAPMDFAKVGEVDEVRSLELIRKYKVTRLSGSSSFLDKISNYIVSNEQTVNSIKYTAQGGSPVSESFCNNMNKAFPSAKNLIVYGSTEVAPISVCEMNELLNASKAGLVGKPVKDLDIFIVKFPKSLKNFNHKDMNTFAVETGEWGEIIVKGPHVVRSYVDNPKATLENKIRDLNNDIWHRTGDVGFLDKDGRLWITGRLSDLVLYQEEVLQPYIVEAEINKIQGVKKSALISSRGRAYLVIERNNEFNVKDLEIKLRDLSIDRLEIVFLGIIPVDVRHSSKIDRVKLRKLIS